MDDFGVEEALLAGLGLEDLGLESVDALLVEGFVVEAGGTGWDCGHCHEDEDCQRNLGLHEKPPQLPVNPRP
jgi:hypothetical protein